MSTRDALLDAGEIRMKQVGYSGFSYADLAHDVQIRKASIHYHFPNKADLAQATMVRYRQSLAESLAGVSTTEVDGLVAGFAQIFLDAYDGPGHGCLCGSLAADLDALPTSVRQEVEGWWGDCTAWLTGAIRHARPDHPDPRAAATLVLALFEGAMTAARVMRSNQPLQLARTAGSALICSANLPTDRSTGVSS